VTRWTLESVLPVTGRQLRLSYVPLPPAPQPPRCPHIHTPDRDIAQTNNQPRAPSPSFSLRRQGRRLLLSRAGPRTAAQIRLPIIVIAVNNESDEPCAQVSSLRSSYAQRLGQTPANGHKKYHQDKGTNKDVKIVAWCLFLSVRSSSSPLPLPSPQEEGVARYNPPVICDLRECIESE
jgi:hypothetical protein